MNYETDNRRLLLEEFSKKNKCWKFSQNFGHPCIFRTVGCFYLEIRPHKRVKFFRAAVFLVHNGNICATLYDDRSERVEGAVESCNVWLENYLFEMDKKNEKTLAKPQPIG